MESNVKKEINNEVRKVTNMMKGSSLDEDSKGKMDFEALEMKIGRGEFQEHMKQKCNKHDLQMAYR
jgi:hypothetical protein